MYSPVAAAADRTRADTAPGGTAARAALRRDALRTAALCALLFGAAALALAGTGAASPWYPLKAALVFAAALALVLHGLPAHLPHARFGAANGVTLARLALVALLAAGIGETHAADAAPAWAAVAVATVAALLDAVDGPLARGSGLASPFGARFDMECDALLILVLCALVLQAGKAGPWILAAGLLRYAFVAAARPWPWLARALPPSLRRKAVCVAQIVALIVCLGPIVDARASHALALASLAALLYSFAADIVWLARRRHHPLLETAP